MDKAKITNDASNRVADWIKFADAKAAAIGSVTAVIIGLSGNLYVSWWAIVVRTGSSAHSKSLVVLPSVLLIFLTYTLLRTLWMVLMTLRARIVNAKPNILFFAHIAELSADEFHDKLAKASVGDLEEAVEQQLHANSIIARRKFSHINDAVVSLVAAVALLLIAAPVVAITLSTLPK